MSNACNSISVACANSIAHACLMYCVEEENDYQSCAYYLSAIMSFFPGLVETATDVMSGLGYQLQKIYPAGFDDVGFKPIFVTTPTILTLLGQTIFILYKYFPDEVSYMRFMQKRTNALKSKLGFLDDSSLPEVVFTFAKARALRKNLQNFKAPLLRAMLELQSSPELLGEMCIYICDILCWTDMSTYHFIHENLCKRRSPVLKDAMVSEEAKNLEVACTAIHSSEYPQYFRILFPYEVTKVMDQSRFPTIAAVAQTLRAVVEVYSVPRTTRKSALVDRLVAVHNDYMETYTNTDPEYLETLESLYKQGCILSNFRSLSLQGDF